jgi:hypothetical protein
MLIGNSNNNRTESYMERVLEIWYLSHLATSVGSFKSYMHLSASASNLSAYHHVRIAMKTAR